MNNSALSFKLRRFNILNKEIISIGEIGVARVNVCCILTRLLGWYVITLRFLVECI